MKTHLSLAMMVFFFLHLAINAQTLVETESEPFTSGPLRGISEAAFAGQEPYESPLYDAPAQGRCGADTRTVADLAVKWIEPSDGVTSATGLIIRLPGIGAGNDCERGFIGDDGIADEKDVIYAMVYYRNASFYPPYDFGKYQAGDVLRGTAKMLELYPEIDRRRLYLLGSSGGGHVALQVLQASRNLWAEVHIQYAITLITVPDDVQNHGYENDPSPGWNANLGWPVTDTGIAPDRLRRYTAERALRSPQKNYLQDPVYEPVGDDTAPPVYMMHGTEDATVDYQHLLDFIAAVSAGSGVDPVTLGSGHWRIGNWEFFTIFGAGHSYSSVSAIRYWVPNAFLRRRTSAPRMSIYSRFPPQQGLTYEFSGSLSNVEVRVVETDAPVTGWSMVGPLE